jgi:hypothetical protein
MVHLYAACVGAGVGTYYPSRKGETPFANTVGLVVNKPQGLFYNGGITPDATKFAVIRAIHQGPNHSAIGATYEIWRDDIGDGLGAQRQWVGNSAGRNFGTPILWGPDGFAIQGGFYIVVQNDTGYLYVCFDVA